MIGIRCFRLSTVLALCAAAWVFAAPGRAATPGATAEAEAPRRFVSRHQGTFAGRKLAYRVVAEDMLIRNAGGETIGSLFSFAYLADGADPAQRPVVFVFNGGPGSASLWMHLGGVGPRRISLEVPAGPGPAPVKIVDNPDSAFGVADLVFVDPIGTGFSRIRGKGTPADFYGSNQDAASIAQFIERWLTANRRWKSPRYLMGESYGTVRASLLANVLLGGIDDTAARGIELDGLIMVGHDGGLIPLSNERRFATNITTMAATAWYHDRVDRRGRTFEQFIASAREFVARDLVPALAAGPGAAPSPPDMARLSEQMSGFIGLPAAYLRAKNLRVSAMAFSQDLLGDVGKETSLFDARYVLPKRTSGDPLALPGTEAPYSAIDDAQLSRTAGPFVAALRVYLADELGVEIADPYVTLVDLDSVWKSSGPRIDPGEALVNAMRRTPHLRVLFLGGWYDVIAGTVGAAEASVGTRLPADRAAVKAYPSGHMCYLGDAASAVGRDVSAFIAAGLETR